MDCSRFTFIACFFSCFSLPPLVRSWGANAPKLLSCDHNEDWSAFSATLDSLKLTADAGRDFLKEPTDLASSLPGVCSKADDFLFRWADQLTNIYWPAEDPWAQMKDIQYNCDPDGIQDASRDKDRCPDNQSKVICFYGMVSCMACMAVMFAANAESKPEWGPHAMSAASSLQTLLKTHEKVGEFIEFSSWPFTLEDLVAIIDVYAPAFAAGDAAATSLAPSSYLRVGSRPWQPGLLTWDAAASLADQSLQLVDRWRWPPVAVPAGACVRIEPLPAQTRPVVFRMWAFGTHCSLMSDPISAMALLLKSEFQVEVTWRGTKDYCGYHTGSWPVPTRDEGSSVKNVLDTFTSKINDTGMDAKQGRSTHKDYVNAPAEFSRALYEVLKSDDAYISADVGFCSEPAYACIAMHRAGKPLIGYFGVHVGFMVHDNQDQLALYQYFRDHLAQDPYSTLATVAPYISFQMFYNMPVEIPAVRPLTLYTLPAVYTATRQDVLVNKRPIAFWDTTAVLNACVKASDAHDFKFIDAAELYKVGQTSYEDWGSFRAGVYFPYDWLQTLTFYDWVNMGLPTFVPNSPLYTYASGTNAPDELEVTTWHVPPAVYRYHFSDWQDTPGRVFWWLLTDFQALPGVQGFSSSAELFEKLASQDGLWKINGQLRLAFVERMSRATTFWRSAVLRALASPGA